MANAIPNIVIDVMRANLRLAFQKHVSLHRCALTWRDAMNLIAPPNHVDALFDLADIADINAYAATANIAMPMQLDCVPSPAVQFVFNRNSDYKRAPLMPRYPQWNRALYPAMAQAVAAQVEHEMKTQRMYASAFHVLDHLNALCTEGSQVRSIWPAVQLLCSDVDSAAVNLESVQSALAWRDKHAKQKVHRSLPRIDPAYRKVLIETSEWLTLASILEHTNLPVGEISVAVRQLHSFALPTPSGDIETVDRMSF